MNTDSQNLQELDQFLIKIKLKNEGLRFYKEREKKYHQIQEYGKQVKALLKKMSKKRNLTFIDCGAGSCYLSFYLSYIFSDKKINFICIDYNEKVIKRAEETAFSLGFSNMQFVCADLVTYIPPENPDLVYSLHACDTATDMSVFTGIRSRAKNILTVSCCQRYTKSQMKGHSLGRITKHKVYKERMTDMVSDTMRSLLLEINGYDTNIFEFSSSKHTDKNVMLRAIKIPLTESRKFSAMCDYNKLRNIFNLEPKLKEYLKQESSQREYSISMNQ